MRSGRAPVVIIISVACHLRCPPAAPEVGRDSSPHRRHVLCTPSPFSRCFNRDGEGVSADWTCAPQFRGDARQGRLSWPLTRQRQCLDHDGSRNTRGKGGVSETKGAETHGKGGVLATKAAEARGKVGV